MLFDKIAFVYFIWKYIYILAREPAVARCQLYWHIFHSLWQRDRVTLCPFKYWQLLLESCQPRNWDTWTKLVPTGNTDYRGWVIVITWPMTSLSGEDRFFLHMLGLFTHYSRAWNVFVSVRCMYFWSNPQTTTHHFSKLNFNSKICYFTVQINAYQEGTIKANTEVNEQVLKNLGRAYV